MQVPPSSTRSGKGQISGVAVLAAQISLVRRFAVLLSARNDAVRFGREWGTRQDLH
jgi:hypothetical protein